MVFSTKVLLIEQDKRDARKISSPAEKAKLWHVKGIRVFYRQKMGCSGANFTQFNFFPLQTYFYAKSHLLSILIPKKKRLLKKKV